MLLVLFSCGSSGLPEDYVPAIHDSELITVNMDTVLAKPDVLSKHSDVSIASGDRTEIVSYAKTLQGIPYKYGSTDPSVGFDCSGFITYVFNHFNIKVPRSSVEFTNVGREVPLALSKPGDLILFTGTDSTIRVVGHMGIVIENADTLRFIHATSGRQYSVAITPLSNYYMGRFVKVIDIY